MTPAAEQALRGLLYVCLNAEADGIPLPADLADAIRIAERELDRSEFIDVENLRNPKG